MAQRPESHPLVLRVMRLGVPSLDDPVKSSAGGSVGCTSISGLGSLVLPQGFGSIARGEVFSACVVAINGSKAAVKDVCMSCELVQGDGPRELKLPVEDSSKDHQRGSRSKDADHISTDVVDLNNSELLRQVLSARV